MDLDDCASEAVCMATVLVVDDVAENRDLVRIVLQSHGYRTVEADSGVAALGVLAREHVDLVLTDVTMPEMDGYQLARHIRADSATCGIPLVFYTADYLAQVADIGGDVAIRMVAKTGDLAALRDAVDETLGAAS
jgi:two-component system cell cycle sensor histidine kinase/response regulator CckA